MSDVLMRAISLSLLALGVLAPGLLAQDKGLRKIEWKLAPGRAAEFVFLDKAGKPSADRKFLVFGSELTPQSNRFIVDTYEELPLPLLFQLPTQSFKAGIGWEHTATFFNDSADAMGGFETMIGGGSIRPVCAQGRYLLKTQKKADDEIATIDGSFSLFEIRRDFINNQTKVTVTKNEMGTLATSVQMSVSKGMILKAGWNLKARAQVRENGRPVEQKIESHQVIEFRDDAELDAAKIQASVDAAIARAVDFLKKQQKSGAWSSNRPNPGPGDVIHLTALVVRALVAAGLPPDDAALVAASKTLRSPAPQETAALGQQILALSCKSPTKEEAEDARKLADELHKRRDPKSAGWGPGGRNDTPNLTMTALALEALAAAPDAKIPDDTFKTGLEAFAGGWADEEGLVDLDLEFEKDAATISADPKKNVIPVVWPAQLGRNAGPFDLRGARKGSFFTLVAALRTMLVVPERVKLEEKGLKRIDEPLRRGLAHLQWRWTLRTVPPVEASWCGQRLEYLGALGPTLAKAKLVRLGGSDWRLEGATLLLREQGDDGSWFSGTDQAVAKTAHALLFLSTVKR